MFFENVITKLEMYVYTCISFVSASLFSGKRRAVASGQTARMFSLLLILMGISLVKANNGRAFHDTIAFVYLHILHVILISCTIIVPIRTRPKDFGLGVSTQKWRWHQWPMDINENYDDGDDNVDDYDKEDKNSDDDSESASWTIVLTSWTF